MNEELLKALCATFAAGLYEWFQHTDNSDAAEKQGVWIDTLATFFALEQCQKVLAEATGPLVCRFSMGVSKDEAKRALQEFLKEVRAVQLQKEFAKDAVDMLSEFLVDFSLSKYSIPQATAQKAPEPNDSDERFTFSMIAESELHGPQAVFEDCLKLMLLPSPLKVLVVKARIPEVDRKALLDGIHRVMINARPVDDISEMVVIGIPGYSQWVDSGGEPKSLPHHIHRWNQEVCAFDDASDWWPIH